MKQRARREFIHARCMKLLVGLALTVPSIPNASANGETSPMLGAALVGGASTTPEASVAGVELDLAIWWNWLGVAAEVSGRTPIDADAPGALILGGSVRLRAMQTLVPSLLEPSDVELAIELQGIVERAVWVDGLTDREPYVRGLGVAARLRGSTDDDTPRLITESRLFVRVLWRKEELDVAARGAVSPVASAHEVTVLVGIGAAFGGGEASYLRQFRRRPFDFAM